MHTKPGIGGSSMISSPDNANYKICLSEEHRKKHQALYTENDAATV